MELWIGACTHVQRETDSMHACTGRDLPSLSLSHGVSSLYALDKKNEQDKARVLDICLSLLCLLETGRLSLLSTGFAFFIPFFSLFGFLSLLLLQLSRHHLLLIAKQVCSLLSLSVSPSLSLHIILLDLLSLFFTSFCLSLFPPEALALSRTLRRHPYHHRVSLPRYSLLSQSFSFLFIFLSFFLCLTLLSGSSVQMESVSFLSLFSCL